MRKTTSAATLLTTLLVLLFSTNNIMAQDATMADLRAVIQQLKSLKTYSYETTSDAVFPNGKKDQMMTTVYMDNPGKRLCYKTNTQLLLLTGQWAYKADHRNKTISVFNVVKYNDKYKKALPELEAVFKSNMAAVFMDSVLLRSGKLLSAKRKGNLTTFRIGFPSDLNIEEMVLVYDNSRQLPESILMRSFYTANATGNQAKGTRVEMRCRGYTTNVPASAFDVQQYFRLQGGKVVLNQYKNYKVSSIL